MADGSYHITPQWKDLIVYDEGEGRQIQFDAGIMKEPFLVSVPAAIMWNQRVPAWAHDRRDLVVERLRVWGCVIEEFDATSRTIFSPDGLFRVWMGLEDDYPAAPRNMMHIILMSGNSTVVTLPDSQIAGIIRFPAPGKVKLPFASNGERFEPEFDIPARTFRVGVDGPKRIELTATMFGVAPATDGYPSIVLRAMQKPDGPVRSILRPALWFAGCVILAGGSAWQMGWGARMLDHGLGALCLVFFGLGVMQAARELLRPRPEQRYPLGQCAKCGYNLRGNVSGVCPECGSRV